MKLTRCAFSIEERKCVEFLSIVLPPSSLHCCVHAFRCKPFNRTMQQENAYARYRRPLFLEETIPRAGSICSSRAHQERVDPSGQKQHSDKWDFSGICGTTRAIDLSIGSSGYSHGDPTSNAPCMQ